MAEKLNVLIATAGRPDLLDRTLRSLTKAGIPASFRGVTVVENGGRYGAEGVVKTYASTLNAKYRFVSQGNKSHALNTALEEVEDGLVIFTDDDVRFHPRFLEAYHEAAAGHERGRFYGGPTDVDYEEDPPNWLRQYFPYSARGWGLNGGLEGEDYKMFLGFNWAAFARDVRDAGGFDPRFGPGAKASGQEDYMQRQLAAAGLERVFVPDALVWHYVPAERSTREWLAQRYYRIGYHAGLRHAGDTFWRRQRFFLGTLARLVGHTLSGAGSKIRRDQEGILMHRLMRLRSAAGLKAFTRAALRSEGDKKDELEQRDVESESDGQVVRADG